MSEPNERVKNHLAKNHVNPKSLPDSVIDTMNTCTQEELDAMYKVGESLDTANVPPGKAITAVH
jgi:hypothetical protein